MFNFNKPCCDRFLQDPSRTLHLAYIAPPMALPWRTYLWMCPTATTPGTTAATCSSMPPQRLMATLPSSSCRLQVATLVMLTFSDLMHSLRPIQGLGSRSVACSFHTLQLIVSCLHFSFAVSLYRNVDLRIKKSLQHKDMNYTCGHDLHSFHPDRSVMPGGRDGRHPSQQCLW